MIGETALPSLPSPSSLGEWCLARMAARAPHHGQVISNSRRALLSREHRSLARFHLAEGLFSSGVRPAAEGLQEPEDRPHRLRDAALAESAASSARSTCSARTGSSKTRAPTASATALAMAAGGALLASSPIALASYGPVPPLEGTNTVSSGGMSRAVGSLYSPRF